MSNTGESDAGMTVEGRIRYLEYIQSSIAQMASASHTTKGWLLPVVAATYAYGVANANVSVALVALVYVSIVALMDANFCSQERTFRHLYEQVARSESGDTTSILTVNPAWSARGESVIKGWLPESSVWTSWIIAPFYGPIFLLGLTVLGLSLAS